MLLFTGLLVPERHMEPSRQTGKENAPRGSAPSPNPAALQAVSTSSLSGRLSLKAVCRGIWNC